MQSSERKESKNMNPYLAINCDDSIMVPRPLWDELVIRYKGELTKRGEEFLNAAINEAEGILACGTCQREQATHESELLCDECYRKLRGDEEDEIQNRPPYSLI